MFLCKMLAILFGPHYVHLFFPQNEISVVCVIIGTSIWQLVVFKFHVFFAQLM